MKEKVFTSSKDGPRLLDCGCQDAESVVERSLGFTDDLLGGTTDHDGASLAQRNTAELEQGLIADHDLLDEVAFAHLDQLGVAESGDDFAAGNEGEALNTVEVGVLNGHDSLVGKQLLGVVVDQLSVDENVDVVLADEIHLVLHFLLLRNLNLGHLGHVLNADSGAEHFDLVRVHGGIGNQDLGILHTFGLVSSRFLVKKES